MAGIPGLTILNPGSTSPTNGSAGNGLNIVGGSLPGNAQYGTPAPAATTNSTVYTGGDGSDASSDSSSDTSTASDVAAYTDQINALNQLLSGLNGTQTTGTNSINNSYNNGLATLNQQQSDALTGYNNQQNQTQNDFQTTTGQINNNARNGINGLQALLGGTGSASDILAPYYVGQQQQTQQQTANNSYADNVSAIQTAIKKAQDSYQNSLTDLGNQKSDAMQKLIGSIDSNKQNYLSQLAAAQNQLKVAQGGTYTDPTAINNQISSLIAQQNNLSSLYPDTNFTVNPVTVDSPDLSGYQAQAEQLSQGSNQPTSADSDPAAALTALLKQNQNAAQQTAYSY